MPNSKKSLPVIRRLPRYYRYIIELEKNGVERVSSSRLAKIMGSTPSQVRQDFNCFGGFGHQGVGYSVKLLHEEIEKLLFPDGNLNAVIVGTQNMGTPIAHFIQTESQGVSLIAAFDSNEDVVGSDMLGMIVHDTNDLVDFCKNNKVDIIVVCTSRDEARELADTISATGVKGIWNYSHFDFSIADPSLIIENVHLRDNLMALTYRVSHKDVE